MKGKGKSLIVLMNVLALVSYGFEKLLFHCQELFKFNDFNVM